MVEPLWERQGLNIMNYENQMRSHVRYDFHKEVEYTINEAGAEKIFKGIIINISEAGLGLYVYNPLNRGQEIILKTDIRELNRKGNIRWCTQLGENIYKVGLMFIN